MHLWLSWSMTSASPLMMRSIPSGRKFRRLCCWSNILIVHDFSQPNDSWIKWQFLFTRYFALAAQMYVPKHSTIFDSQNPLIRSTNQHKWHNWSWCNIPCRCRSHCSEELVSVPSSCREHSHASGGACAHGSRFVSPLRRQSYSTHAEQSMPCIIKVSGWGAVLQSWFLGRSQL